MPSFFRRSKLDEDVFAPDLPVIAGDRVQLQQVLLNLTINSIQAVHGHDASTPGHLWVDAALVKPRSNSAASEAEPVIDSAERVRISILILRAHSTSLGETMQVAQSPVGKVLSRWAIMPPMAASRSTR